MSKKQTVTMHELKVGEEVEITIKTKVLGVDSGDDSILVEGARGSRWIWPGEYANIKLRAAERPPIPEDASAVSFLSSDGDIVFATKGEDGTWTDSDGDEYATADLLIEDIREYSQIDSIQVYDKRGV
ncbi:hypothetical protein SEA_MUSETTA_16 [Microbacterium phage Musetta]|nr:hypothetical protein SEA_MUSETTA_16 [Microbacterium phage Musetta]WNO25911.1 hypothetical protein SEA_ASEGATO_15 [Microbacterium phage ASegato]